MDGKREEKALANARRRKIDLGSQSLAEAGPWLPERFSLARQINPSRRSRFPSKGMTGHEHRRVVAARK